MYYNSGKIQNELIKDLSEFYGRFGAKETINSFEEEILSLNNAQVSLFFSNIKGADLKSHGQIVLDSGNIELISKFAHAHFDDAQEQIDYIVNSGNAAYNFKLIEALYEKYYNFARNFARKNIGYCFTKPKIPAEFKKQLEKCIDVIIQSGDSEYCYKFIKWFSEHINGKIDVYRELGVRIITEPKNVGKPILADLKRKVFEAEAVIIQEGNAKYNYLCADTMTHLSHEHVEYNYRSRAIIQSEDIDYTGHSKAIIQSEDAEYNYLYARNYGNKDGVNVKAHGIAVVKSNDPEYNYSFALKIKDADIEKHGKAVIKSKSLSHNYDFARAISGANILKHGKVILDSKDAEYNYLFARDIEGADLEAHSRIVLESKNPKYNYLLCKLDRDDFDDYKHRITVLESKDLEYNFRLAEQFPEHELYEQHCDVIMCSGNESYTSRILYLKPTRVSAIKEKIKILSA